MLLNPFRQSKADVFTELIFENRNKNYGAYILRRDYSTNVNKAFLITVGSLAFLLLAGLILRSKAENIITMGGGNNGSTTLDNKKYIIETEKPPQRHTQQKATPPNTDTHHYQVTDTTNSPDPIDTTTAPVVTSTTTTTPGGDNGGTGTTGGSGTGTAGIDSTTGSAPVIDNNRVLGWSEVMPEFPGGNEALIKYLSRHISCRGRWLEEGDNGTIIFSLVINRYGEVTDVKVEQDNVHYDCAEQATEVIKNMPRWSPGTQNKIPVNVKYILPVTYQKHD